MDHPIKDIPAVMRKFAHGTAQEQHDALRTYFLPTASLTTAFLRVPPMSDFYVQHLGIVNSRRLIQLLFRLKSLLIPTLKFDIQSAVYDQKTATLTVHATQTLSPVFLPFHQPTLSSTLIFRLSQRTIDRHGRVAGPSTETPVAMGLRTRVFISEVEALVQPSEVLKLFVPFVGARVWELVRMCFTLWLAILGSVLVPVSELLPQAIIRNGDAMSADKVH